MKIEHKRYILCCALIIILGIICYFNSLNGQFIWDDAALVRDNTYIRSWSNIGKIFVEDVGMHLGMGAGIKYSFYRPLQLLSYMFDYSFWRLNTLGYHLTNLILHILVGLSLFWLANLLFGNLRLSLFTSFLFITHPVHTEAVSYISGRADPLAALFILLCFIFYIKSYQTNKVTLLIMTCLTYALALLSRENALILPILLLLYHYSFKQRLKNKQFLFISSLALIYIFIRFTLIESFSSHISSSSNLWQRFPGFFVALTNYARVLILPFHLHMEYGDKLFNLSNPQAVLGIFIFGALFIYALRRRSINAPASFSVLWFLISLLPFSNLYPLNAYMAEHWLYLPSIGFFIIIAHILSNLYNKTKQLRIPTIVLSVFLVVFYSCLTIQQNNYWRQPITFYEKTLKYVPDSPKVYNNLGMLYGRAGRKEEALELFKKAIELKPDYAEAYNNFGLTYYASGLPEEASASYKKAIQVNPDYADAYYNLGSLYNALGRQKQAISSFKKALQLNANYAKAYNNLGLTYYAMDKKEQARTLFKKTINIDPYNCEAYNNLGNTYYDQADYDQAILFYKKAIEINPDFANPYNNLAIVYFRQQKYKLAIEYSDQARKLGFSVNPAFAEELKLYRDRKLR